MIERLDEIVRCLDGSLVVRAEHLFGRFVHFAHAPQRLVGSPHGHEHVRHVPLSRENRSVGERSDAAERRQISLVHDEGLLVALRFVHRQTQMLHRLYPPHHMCMCFF